MNPEVLVRSSDKAYDLIIGMVLGGLTVLGGGIALAAGNAVLACILAFVGLLIGVASAIGLWHRLRTRMWLADTGKAFTLRDRTGERTIDYAEVLSIAVQHKRNYVNGELQSIQRKLTLWISGPQTPEKLVFNNAIPLQEADPLGEFIDRLHQRHLAEAKAMLAKGESVLGKDWSLDRKSLTVLQSGQEHSQPMSNISAAHEVDGKYCIWVSGQEQPWTRLPIDGAHVYVLMALLAEELAKRPQTSEEPPEGELGRIIFERTAGVRVAVPLVCCGILVVLTMVLGVMAFNRGLNVVLPLLPFSLAMLCLVWAAYAHRFVFRCHEWGVYKRSIASEKRLRYTEVAAFQYAATRMFVNGAYTGTTVALTFGGLEGASIAYSTQVQGEDMELDKLRDHISGVVAANMRRRLEKGESVDWTKNLRFTKEGIEHRPKGFFGSRKEFELIPYEEIRTHDLQQGVFYLWVLDQEKPVIQQQVGAKNFFPGWLLLGHLLQPKK